MHLRSAALAALAVVSLSFASGCAGHSLLDDVKERSYWKQARRDQGYLGVVVSRASEPDGAGVRVVHVIKASPASKIGLREGDFIREVYGDPFETPPSEVAPETSAGDGLAFREAEAPAVPPGRRIENGRDLESALGRAGPQSKVTLVVARGNEIMTIPVRLESTQPCWTEQTRLVVANAEDNKSTVSLPLLFSYERQRIDPEVYRDYMGVAVKEPVRRYLDVDVLPILFVSLFRYESVPSSDSWRLKILCWPLVWTSFGDHDAGTEGIAEPGQEGLTEL